jgi:PHD/YefM family antitoxin component YafN of YafNO toxin-antitoxin module
MYFTHIINEAIMEVSATKFVRSFAEYRDKSVKEPVIVKNHERVVGVFVSADDYAIVQAAKALRRSITLEEMPLHLLDALAQGHNRLMEEEAEAERHADVNHKGDKPRHLNIG